MHNAFSVSGVEGVGDLDGEIEEGLGVDGAAHDAVLQGGAFEKLHGDEGLALVLSDLVNCTNVGMVQAGCGAGLAAEALERSGVMSDIGRKELEGYETAEFGVLGFVDDTHAAATQL